MQHTSEACVVFSCTFLIHFALELIKISGGWKCDVTVLNSSFSAGVVIIRIILPGGVLVEIKGHGYKSSLWLARKSPIKINRWALVTSEPFWKSAPAPPRSPYPSPPMFVMMTWNVREPFPQDRDWSAMRRGDWFAVWGRESWQTPARGGAPELH